MTDEKTIPTQIDWTAGFPVIAGPLYLGLTESSPESAEYWAGIACGELRLKRCLRCRRYLHPRRMACPDCYLAGVEWSQASGRGEVYSFSVIHRAPTPALQAIAPYCVGIVLLEEGVHLFTRLIFSPGAEPAVGQEVEVSFRVLESGQHLPVFSPRGQA